jgi:hypothetical protein
MHKFRNLEEALLAHAINQRYYSELGGWSPETICEGYDYDPNNPAWGQCGITRNALCLRLYAFTIQANAIAELEAAGHFPELNGERRPIPPGFFRGPQVDRLREWRELFGDWQIACVDGGGRITRTRKKFGDHCWTKVAPPGSLEDPKAGIYVDSTLDQFSRKLPKILAQRASATDGPVTFLPETIKRFGQHDTSGRRTEERYGIYQSEQRWDSFWMWYGPGNLLSE